MKRRNFIAFYQAQSIPAQLEWVSSNNVLFNVKHAQTWLQKFENNDKFKSEDDLKNEVEVKNEDDIKNEDDLKHEDDLKNEDNLKIKTHTAPPLRPLLY